MLSEKGQEFTVFRFLIAGVMAVMILFIANTILQQYAGQGAALTPSALKDGIKSVVAAQGTQKVKLEDMLFDKGMGVNAKTLAEAAGIEESKVWLICNESAFDRDPKTNPTKDCIATQRLAITVNMCYDKSEQRYYVMLAAPEIDISKHCS